MLAAYPSITQDDFSEACQSLETRCSDRIDGTEWLSVKWTGGELRIKQRRYVKKKQEENDGGKELESDAGVNVQWDEVDREIVEDSDEENVVSLEVVTTAVSGDQSQLIEINFSITLSPTYSVPILWLSSLALRTIDQVHENLLPEHLGESIGAVGVMGGISQAVSLKSFAPR